MAATEIRAKEASVQLTVDGQRLGGSFSTIHDLAIRPDKEIAKKQFPGEKRFRADLNVKGFDFSFKVEKNDHAWWTVWKKIESAEHNGTAFPVISIAVTYKYRDGRGQLRTVVLHGDLVMAPDDDNAAPLDGYPAVTWSGACSYASGS